MRLLGKQVLDFFPNRVINLHPALLPSFPGANGIRDAFDAGVKVTGVTVHFANEVFDEGPIIAQEPVVDRRGRHARVARGQDPRRRARAAAAGAAAHRRRPRRDRRAQGADSASVRSALGPLGPVVAGPDVSAADWLVALREREPLVARSVECGWLVRAAHALVAVDPVAGGEIPGCRERRLSAVGAVLQDAFDAERAAPCRRTRALLGRLGVRGLRGRARAGLPKVGARGARSRPTRCRCPRARADVATVPLVLRRSLRHGCRGVLGGGRSGS